MQLSKEAVMWHGIGVRILRPKKDKRSEQLKNKTGNNDINRFFL
jgi:hypothetical protein